MNTLESCVVAENLTKTYYIPVRKTGFMAGLRQLFSQDRREVKAVSGVTFTVPEGQCVGYIGPNGAGKSTTIKMLTGILHPTTGLASVRGISPQKDRQRLAKEIGVVFGQRTQLWWDLPTRDSFEILGAMYEVPVATYRERLRELDDLLGLSEFMDQPVRRLSLGQRMRADLAASLIHAPKVLFLDEPTIGLDVVAKAAVRDFLARINRERGITIILTTHDLRDIEELCDRVLIINHGSLIYDGTLHSLKEQAVLPTILNLTYATLPSSVKAGQFLETQNGPPRAACKVVSVDSETKAVQVLFDRNHTSAPAVIWAMQSLGEVVDFSLAEPTIEDIIKRLLE